MNDKQDELKARKAWRSKGNSSIVLEQDVPPFGLYTEYSEVIILAPSHLRKREEEAERRGFNAAREPREWVVTYGTPGRFPQGQKYPTFADYEEEKRRGKE